MAKDNSSPILKKWTRQEIADKTGYSYQTVINWFDPEHPSSMPVKCLEILGFGIINKDVYGKTLEQLLVDLDEVMYG